MARIHRRGAARTTRAEQRDAFTARHEELALLVAAIAAPAARAIAERARERLEASSIPIAGGSLRVTASFGVAELLDGELVGHALRRADQAMYLAKQRGRNRVEVDASGRESPPPPPRRTTRQPRG